MYNPKILLTTYHQAFTKRAGGEFEMFNISESLRQSGLIADIYGPFSRELEHYDVVLHFSVHGGGRQLLRHIKENGKPIVLLPNIWLSERNLNIEEMVEEYIDLSNLIIFKSKAEQNMFETFFRVSSEKIRTTTTLADAAYLNPAPTGLFKAVYDVDQYLIGVGIIEPNKNQLNVIQAIKGTGKKLVLVGGHRDGDYFEACKAAGKEHVLFIDALPVRSELIRSALSESQAFIECSHEPPGLSAVEAGLAGASLVLSDSAWTNEHFGAHAHYCNPDNPGSINQAIKRATSQTQSSKLLMQEHLKPLCQGRSIKSLVSILEEATK